MAIDKSKLTAKQLEVVGQVMADAFGANIQSGMYAGHDDWAFVAWQYGPNTPTHIVYIDPEGMVTYA